MTQPLPQPITEYIEASNAFDGPRMSAAFADDAMVNDARREFWGREAITRWLEKEVIGDRVTMAVTQVKEHYGQYMVDAVMDGDYDKKGLPEVLTLSHYFTLRDDRIVTLVIIRNQVEGHA
jgi:hypothetical protein